MNDTETFKALAKTKVRHAPLVKLCLLEIIAADDGDYQTTAQQLEKLRKYLEPFAKEPSIREVGTFAVASAIEAGEPRNRWVKLEARINVYRRLLNEDSPDENNSDGDPDPIPAPDRRKHRTVPQR